MLPRSLSERSWAPFWSILGAPWHQNHGLSHDFSIHCNKTLDINLGHRFAKFKPRGNYIEYRRMLYFSLLICERRAAEGHPRLPTDHLSWAAFILFLLICERRAAGGHPRRTTDHLSWAGGRRPPLLMLNSFVRLRFQGSWLLPTLSNGRFTHQRIAIRALEF